MATQYDGWSVVAQYRKCGKGSCKVCAEGRGHGPYFYGTKTVDGQRRSKYFGKQPPDVDARVGTPDNAIALRAEVNALREENRRLRAWIEELRSELDKRGPSLQIKAEDDVLAPAVETTPAKQSGELTRRQVEEIWQEETDGTAVEPDILNEAYESLMRGLFRSSQDEHTRIKTGSGRRPYVCPFRTSGRGARRTFANPERLVRTAVPWVVEHTASQAQRSAQLKQKAEDRVTQHRQRYERMTTAELVQLRDRMAASLEAGSNLGWTLSLPELEEEGKLIEAVLKDR